MMPRPARLATGPRVAFVAIVFATIACAAPPAEKTAGHPATRASAAAAPAKRHPPKVPAERAVELVNAGFESGPAAPTGGIEGWYWYQHAGETSYQFVLDGAVKHGGARSVRIDNVGSQPYGSIAQIVNGTDLAGKTVRFSAWLRTTGADGAGASLFVIAEGVGVLAYDTMAGAEVKGTREWARYSVTLPLPPATTRVRVGATLQGKGSAWFDDAELEVASGR
jgi:hypothetical protein